jgi:hypothetical protein
MQVSIITGYVCVVGMEKGYEKECICLLPKRVYVD